MFKYRAKNLKGEWVKLTFLQLIDLVKREKLVIDPSTLGVCWGMKDNNGKDVYTVRVDILQIIDETLRVCRKRIKCQAKCNLTEKALEVQKAYIDTAENCYSMASSNKRT